jgi:hypothetical protein
MLAIDILKWPGMNQAFLFSFALTMILTGLIFLISGSFTFRTNSVGSPTRC